MYVRVTCETERVRKAGSKQQQATTTRPAQAAPVGREKGGQTALFECAKRKAETRRRTATQEAKANEHLEGDAHQPSVGEELRPGVQLEHGLLESMAVQRRNAGDESRFVVEAVPTSIRVLVPAQEVVLDVLKLTK